MEVVPGVEGGEAASASGASVEVEPALAAADVQPTVQPHDMASAEKIHLASATVIKKTGGKTMKKRTRTLPKGEREER